MAQTITGTVVSAGNDKTIVIRVDQRRTHKLYHKQYTVSDRFQVHDKDNEAQVGDTIEASQGRRVSKSKSLHLVKVVTKAPKA